MKKMVVTILFTALALYGCSGDDGGSGGSAGSAGTGGTAGSGGTAGGGTAGSGGMGGDGGMGGGGGSGEVVLYEQDFEPPPAGDIDAESVTALSDDGWLATTNLLDGNGDFVMNFGVAGAPNATASPGAFFSAVVSGQGGAPQGAQQLSIFNDYFCCGVDRGHNDSDGSDGFDKVESIVFQQINPIPADLVGKTLTLFFEGKEAPEFAVGGNTTAQGFIKTLNGTSFLEIDITSVDTTDLPVDWTSYSVSFDITADKMEEGQILQFGFQTVAEQGEPSTNIYDNVRVTEQPTP